MQHAPPAVIYGSVYIYMYCTRERHINNIIYCYSNDNFFDSQRHTILRSSICNAILRVCFVFLDFLFVFSCRFSQFGSITFGKSRKKAKLKGCQGGKFCVKANNKSHKVIVKNKRKKKNNYKNNKKQM